MTLQGAIKQLHELRCNEDMPVFFKPVIAEVINVLLMDAEEVRHGRWIKKYRGNYLCSVCGAWYRTTDDYGNIIDGEMKSNYCESCGAKMDEVEE